MSKVKYAFAMLAAGGATVSTAPASAAVTLETLNITPTAPATEIKLAGSSQAQFTYGAFTVNGGVSAKLTPTTLGAVNPQTFATGELPIASESFQNGAIITADVTAGQVKNANVDGEAFYHLKFSSNGEDYLGTARIARDASLASVAYDKAGAVPEPGAWALMILGFGATGAALRQRRRGQSLSIA